MESLSEKFEILDQALDKTNNPLLVIHPNPDADALGSAFALSEHLQDRLKTKTIKIFCKDLPGEKLGQLFGGNKISQNYNIKDHDLIIVLDRGDIFYVYELDQEIEMLEKKPVVINIDHHPNTFIPDVINVLDKKAAATSEILFRYFDHIQYALSPQIAQFLLNGIYADTGGFRHNNTTSESLEIASRLMRKGASISKVNRSLFANKSLQTMKLWGIALERAQINPKTGMAVSFITKIDLERCGATPADLDGISEILNTISESKFSLILSEREQNKIKASLRSEEHKGIDVSKIARKFSGGGHMLASGFEIKGRLRQVGNSWIIE